MIIVSAMFHFVVNKLFRPLDVCACCTGGSCDDNVLSLHLGMHWISIPAGFKEFSGIRPDLEKIRPDLNFCFHLKKFTNNGINHQFGSFKV